MENVTSLNEVPGKENSYWQGRTEQFVFEDDNTSKELASTVKNVCPLDLRQLHTCVFQ